jgi:hypothetical protein
METVKLSEQDIVNAICVHIAHKRQIKPEQVSVELMWDEEYGYSAEIWVEDRKQILVESNMVEAIRYWLQNYMQIDPFSAGIEFVLSEQEGIVANIRY